MAVLKHLSSKNADYGKALEYLMFQHNERTQQPIIDANGNMMLRDEYYLDGLRKFMRELRILHRRAILVKRQLSVKTFFHNSL